MQETLRIYDSLIFKAQSIELLCFLTTIQKIQMCNSCLNFFAGLPFNLEKKLK